MLHPGRTRTLIAWAHLLGGLFGLGGLLLPAPSGTTWPDSWYVGGVALFGLSVASGLALLRRHSAAVRLAMLVEGLQLLAFHTGRAGFLFYSGLQALVIVTPTTVRASASFQSQFGIGSTMHVAEPFIALDFGTLLVWWLLVRTRALSAAEPALDEQAVVERAV